MQKGRRATTPGGPLSHTGSGGRLAEDAVFCREAHVVQGLTDLGTGNRVIGSEGACGIVAAEHAEVPCRADSVDSTVYQFFMRCKVVVRIFIGIGIGTSQNGLAVREILCGTTYFAYTPAFCIEQTEPDAN